MDAIQYCMLGLEVAVVAAPLAVSLLTCAKKKQTNKGKAKKPIKPSTLANKSTTADVSCKEKKSEADPLSRKDKSIKDKSFKDKSVKDQSIKQSDDVSKKSSKVQSYKADSKKEDSMKASEKSKKKVEEKSNQDSAKSTSQKSAKASMKEQSKKEIGDSRKEDSQKSISTKKDVSVEVVGKLPSDESSKKGSAERPREAIAVEPKELRIAASENVTTKLILENKSDTRKAIKIRCSDNRIFRIDPVYALVEPNSNATVEVSRAKGSAKPDKLAVVVVEADTDAKDGREVFKASPATNDFLTVNVPVFAA